MRTTISTAFGRPKFQRILLFPLMNDVLARHPSMLVVLPVRCGSPTATRRVVDVARVIPRLSERTGGAGGSTP